MPMTASDVLHNADAFRRAHPGWPHAAPEPAAARPAPSWLDLGRIATRYACGLLTVTEAVALLEKAGCTLDEAWAHLAVWQKPVTEIIDPQTEWFLARADD
jgi:hypothetical protein